MKTITIEMPTTLFTETTGAIVENYATYKGYVTYNKPANRTRMVFGQFEDYFKKGEEFLPCTYSADGKTCYMHLKLQRVNKAHCNVLDEMIEYKIITSYSY